MQARLPSLRISSVEAFLTNVSHRKHAGLAGTVIDHDIVTLGSRHAVVSVTNSEQIFVASSTQFA